jgi:hypothetical protein
MRSNLQLEVRGATIVVRSVSLTKNLLKQMRRIHSWPRDWELEERDENSIKKPDPKYIVGYLSGVAIGEYEHDYYLLLQDHEGDYCLMKVGDIRWWTKKTGCKQLYI